MKRTQQRIIRMLAILGFIQLSFLMKAQVVPNIDWVQHYVDRDSTDNSASALDADNNVYITGYAYNGTDRDLIILKYDSLGTLLWSDVYDNGGADEGVCVKVDILGQVYVTGTSYDGTTGDDIITRVYNSAGTLLMSDRYNVGGSRPDYAAELVVNNTTGDFYIIGSSEDGSFYMAATVLKYKNSFSLDWGNQYHGSSNNDYGLGISITSNNDVLCTGQADNGVDVDIWTFKVDQSGSKAWDNIIAGTANNNDIPEDIVSSGEDAVICGKIDGVDYVTARINGNSGSIVWQQIYDDASQTNYATSLVRDSIGNIGVTGIVFTGGGMEYHTLMYDSTGTQLWVNKEVTGLSGITIEPRISVDTVAHHFYVSGSKLNTNSDVMVYQISPFSGATKWKQFYDGPIGGIDVGTGIAVSGLGYIYLSANCENSTAGFNQTTIRLSQTPTYTVPNAPGSTDVQSQNWIYYENKGQILKKGTSSVAGEVQYYTQFSDYPEYIGLNKMSYKICNPDTAIGINDTTQRIDIVFHKSNTYSALYPSNQASGLFNFLHGEALADKVTDVKGYRNLGIPNIYTSIDQHYTSNANGMKIQYVLKPNANSMDIQWKINGADSVKIVSNKLEIYHYRGKIVWSQPVVYTVDSVGNPQAITGSATWSLLPNDNFAIIPPAYNINKPLIIELDHGNTAYPPYPAIKNLVASLYYGGYTDEGFIDIDVDPVSHDWVAIGSTRGGDFANAFPVVTGAQISITSYTNTPNEYMFVLVFKPDGTLITANTYGLSGTVKPLRAILNDKKVTVVGDCNIGGYLPLYTSQQSALAANAFSINTGEGFIMQFEITSTPPSTIQSINTIKWNTRLNGKASDIDVTPNGKHIYVTSSTAFSMSPMNVMTQTGSYNNGGLTGTNDINFQVWKFDSLGQRKWSAVLPIINDSNQYLGNASFYKQYSNTALVMNQDQSLKCRIKTDNYGFYLAGETNRAGNLSYSKYGAPLDNSYNGWTDGFFARFNKRDSLVYCSYVGGILDDGFNELTVVNPNQVALIGYSTSKYSGLLTPPNASEYSDTANDVSLASKLLICKFDSIGNKTWATFFGKNNFNSDAVGWSITHDNKGTIYMTGMDNNKFPLVATNSSSVFSQTNIANTEGFMLAFASYNQPIWNTKFGGVEDDIGLALDFNTHQGTNYVIMGGMTPSRSEPYLLPSMSYSFPVVEKPFGSVTTWTQTYVIIGRSDGFFSFFTTDIVTGVKEYFSEKNSSASTFELFPNPSQLETNIAFKNKLEGKVEIEVYNQIGQVVAFSEEKDIPAFSLININTANIPPGLYIVTVRNRGKSYSKKLVVSR